MRPSLPSCSRRRFLRGSLALAGLGLLAGCGVLPPQRWQPARVPRISYLTPHTSTGPILPSLLQAFREGLREHGHTEGQTFAIDQRSAEGEADRLPALAAELVRLPVDIILAHGVAAIQAAKTATTTIPIVMATSADAVRTGLVASLGRPGGNVTGLTSLNTQLAPKRLELLKEAVPGISRLGVLWHPAIRGREHEYSETEVVAHALGVQLLSLEVRSPDGFPSAFEAALRDRADALLTLDNFLTVGYQRLIADFAAQHRLPALAGEREFAVGGGLMAYGPSLPDSYRHAATYVDKILKGASPADIPVEQPTKFDFAVNLKTAQALGLTIPDRVRMQATELIQ
jgi:putative ABC transport system substrate-binding protein